MVNSTYFNPYSFGKSFSSYSNPYINPYSGGLGGLQSYGMGMGTNPYMAGLYGINQVPSIVMSGVSTMLGGLFQINAAMNGNFSQLGTNNFGQNNNIFNSNPYNPGFGNPYNQVNFGFN